MGFISTAYAQAAGAAPSGTAQLLTQLPMLLAIGVVFWFFLLRPQKKAADAHKALLAGVRRGDRIAMKGGLLGKVVRVQDTELTVEIADGVRVQVERVQLDRILAKTEPAKGEKADNDDDAGDTPVAVESPLPAEKPSFLQGLLGGGKK